MVLQINLRPWVMAKVSPVGTIGLPGESCEFGGVICQGQRLMWIRTGGCAHIGDDA